MMRAEFSDDTGNQIPVEFEEGGSFVSRWLEKLTGLKK